MSFANEPNFTYLPDEFPGAELEPLETTDFDGDVSASARFLPRTKLLWIPFVIPTALCGLSYLAGGIPILTDVGFVVLTILCALQLLIDLYQFPRRFGIGGIVLFGGVLVWFCYDYLVNYCGADASSTVLYGDLGRVIAKQACLYCLFVMFMTIGIGLPAWGALERRLASIPEPHNPTMYLVSLLLMLSVGLSAFLFTRDFWPVAVVKGALSPWLHESVEWSVGRTGNYNTSWGGYVGQLLAVGTMSAIVGAIYSVYIARGLVTRLLGWTIWLYWTLAAYGTGRRGGVAFLVLPAMAFVYLKYQMRVLTFGKRHNIKGFAVVGVLGLILLVVVQIQGAYRNVGLGDEVDISRVSLIQLQGNYMFSEAVPGFRVVPDEVPFFGNRIPGEGLVRAMPETLYWFFMGPIPRALWPDKPSDSAMIWYNKLVAGTDGKEGTTISQGLVGHWYFRYGVAGVIEGGLLLGWLMGMSERLLRAARDRPMTILAAFSLAAWLFRTYRNFYFIELYGPLIGIAVFVVIARLLGLFGGGSAQNEWETES